MLVFWPIYPGDHFRASVTQSNTVQWPLTQILRNFHLSGKELNDLDSASTVPEINAPALTYQQVGVQRLDLGNE